MNNILTDVVPAHARKVVYAVFAGIGVVLGAAQVGFDPDPAWLETSLDVYVYLGVALGLTAASNVSTPAPDAQEDVGDDA